MTTLLQDQGPAAGHGEPLHRGARGPGARLPERGLQPPRGRGGGGGGAAGGGPRHPGHAGPRQHGVLHLQRGPAARQPGEHPHEVTPH